MGFGSPSRTRRWRLPSRTCRPIPVGSSYHTYSTGTSICTYHRNSAAAPMPRPHGTARKPRPRPSRRWRLISNERIFLLLFIDSIRFNDRANERTDSNGNKRIHTRAISVFRRPQPKNWRWMVVEAAHCIGVSANRKKKERLPAVSGCLMDGATPIQSIGRKYGTVHTCNLKYLP